MSDFVERPVPKVTRLDDLPCYSCGVGPRTVHRFDCGAVGGLGVSSGSGVRYDWPAVASRESERFGAMVWE